MFRYRWVIRTMYSLDNLEGTSATRLGFVAFTLESVSKMCRVKAKTLNTAVSFECVVSTTVTYHQQKQFNLGNVSPTTMYGTPAMARTCSSKSQTGKPFFSYLGTQDACQVA